MRVTTIILKSSFTYDIIRRSMFPLIWQYHLCPDYNKPSVGHSDENFLQISLAVILRILFGSVVWKNTFLIADFISKKLLISTRLMNCHVTFTLYIDREVYLTKSKILLLKNILNEPIVKGWSQWKKTIANRLQIHKLQIRIYVLGSCEIKSTCASKSLLPLIHKSGPGWWPKYLAPFTRNPNIFCGLNASCIQPNHSMKW